MFLQDYILLPLREDWGGFLFVYEDLINRSRKSGHQFRACFGEGRTHGVSGV